MNTLSVPTDALVVDALIRSCEPGRCLFSETCGGMGLGSDERSCVVSAFSVTGCCKACVTYVVLLVTSHSGEVQTFWEKERFVLLARLCRAVISLFSVLFRAFLCGRYHIRMVFARRTEFQHVLDRCAGDTGGPFFRYEKSSASARTA